MFPNEIRTEPSAVWTKPGTRERGRSWTGVLPPGRKNGVGACIGGLYGTGDQGPGTRDQGLARISHRLPKNCGAGLPALRTFPKSSFVRIRSDREKSRLGNGEGLGNGSRMGIRALALTRMGNSRNLFKIMMLMDHPGPARSILGEIGWNGKQVIQRERDSKLLPYQELSESVLLWHATCIRKGQKNQEMGIANRNQGTGNRVWELATLTPTPDT